MSWRSQRKNLPEDSEFHSEYQCELPPKRDFKNLNDPNLAPGDWILLESNRRGIRNPSECHVIHVEGERVVVGHDGRLPADWTLRRSEWAWDERTRMNVPVQAEPVSRIDHERVARNEWR